MKHWLAACLLLAWLAWPAVAAATGSAVNSDFQAAVQAYPASSPPTLAAPPALDPRDREAIQYRRDQDELYLKIVFSVTGVAIAFLVFALWLSTRAKDPLSSRDVLRAAVVIFIAYGGIVLALAYPKNETMTGVIGILSAIAGYVFGRSGGASEEGTKT